MLQIDLAFSTLREARDTPYMLMERSHAFICMAGMRIKDHDVMEDLIPLRDNLLSKLMDRHSIFSQLDCNTSGLEICASSNLLMYHNVAIIRLST